MANKNLLRRIVLEEYKGTYKREMHVLAVGSWWSLAGFTVTDGIGWKPSALAGIAGDDVQKYN